VKSEFSPNSTMILVCAAWADGSCWGNLILPLERRDLYVMCAPIPTTSLTDDANALTRARWNGPAAQWFWRDSIAAWARNPIRARRPQADACGGRCRD
jgi:hypothetical protein